jgi:hypothetical protein
MLVQLACRTFCTTMLEKSLYRLSYVCILNKPQKMTRMWMLQHNDQLTLHKLRFALYAGLLGLGTAASNGLNAIQLACVAAAIVPMCVAPAPAGC